MAAIFAALYLAAFIFRTPAVYPDPAPGLLAAAQNTAGLTPRFDVVRTFDFRDDAQETFERISWWPPSYQLLPWICMRFAGLSLGDAVKATVWLLLLTGLTGWFLYFRKSLSVKWSIALLCALASWRFVHHWMDFYDGGEILLFAFCPWVLLFLGKVISLDPGHALHRSCALIFTAGFACGSMFFLKYSAVAIVAGYVLAACIVLLRTKIHAKVPKLIILIASSALPILLVYFLILRAGTSPGASGLRQAWSLSEVAWHWVCWPMALADWDALGRYVLLNDQSCERNLLRLLPIGLVLLVAHALLGFAILKRRPYFDKMTTEQEFFLFASSVSLIAMLILVSWLGMRGGALSWEVRYYRCCVIGLLPFLTLAARRITSARDTHIHWLAVPFVVLVLTGSTYGVVVFFQKTLLSSAAPEYRKNIHEGYRLNISASETRLTEICEFVIETHKSLQNSIILVEDQRVALLFAKYPVVWWEKFSDVLKHDDLSTTFPRLIALVRKNTTRASLRPESIENLPPQLSRRLLYETPDWLVVVLENKHHTDSTEPSEPTSSTGP